MPLMKGSCRCGSVSYIADADPVFTGLCHCRNCQKETGSAFSVVIAVPTPALNMTGKTKVFDSVGDTGKPTHRAFCPECGTSVTHWADILGGLIMINVGTLDDPSRVKPTMQIYCDSAQPWVKLDSDMQSCPKMPA